MERIKVVRTHYILNLKETRLPQSIGNKAKKLHFLIEKRFNTPVTYVCTWDAYIRYLRNDQQISGIVKDELSRIIDEGRNYAVRSSANLEDVCDHSFAGQFKSILNVHGVDNIMQAIETIWSSTYSKGVKTYLEKIGIDQPQLKMAVIIQEMVPPALSGVSFSKNPITGMDETIVEAVTGSGESLLQDGITPGRWVNKWGEWTQRPENENIDLSIIKEVVTKTKEISRAYGEDVDLEWVYDGSTINWVQLREITSLKNNNLYSNTFAKEVFPGMIKPLIWSTNVPIVCGAWTRLFTELIGKISIDPNSLAKSFYYRAYFNMGTIGKIFEALGLPRNTIELLMEVDVEGTEKPSFKPTKRTLLLLPKIMRCAIDKITFARKTKEFFPAVKLNYQSFSIDQINHLSEKDIISEIERLYALNEKTAYYTINTYLLMGLYNGILKYQLKKIGVDFENFDVTRDMDDLKRFDPNVNLKNMSQQFNKLDEKVKDKIRKSTFAEFLMLKGIDALQRNIVDFFKQFGHLSNSGNDFSSVPWREEPDVILKMIVNYTHSEDKCTVKLHFANLNISTLRRLLLTPIYKRARNFRLYREEVSFLYTFGYGLFRAYFLALGDHFVRRGLITDREDIFYLYFDEVKTTVEKGPMEGTYQKKIAQRKREIKEYQDTTLPNTIYGDHQPPVKTQKGTKLKGIPTSKGYYKGRLRVIQGIQDLHKLRDGDILVIPYSDVGWTPLFTRAGAIIAESGGFLSHSSIIAREYGIPAIVSVTGACRLKDDTIVTVDGYQGEIIIHGPSVT